MKLRTIAAGLVLSVAVSPVAFAGPKPAPAPQPVSSAGGAAQPNFFCPIFPWLAMCHPR